MTRAEDRESTGRRERPAAIADSTGVAERAADSDSIAADERTMTREQMIDEAVRRSIKRRTMKSVLNRRAFTEHVRRTCVPGPLDSNGQPAWVDASGLNPDGLQYANPGWWGPANPFLSCPRRLAAIRTEFNRIAAEHAHV